MGFLFCLNGRRKARTLVFSGVCTARYNICLFWYKTEFKRTKLEHQKEEELIEEEQSLLRSYDSINPPINSPINPPED